MKVSVSKGDKIWCLLLLSGFISQVRAPLAWLLSQEHDHSRFTTTTTGESMDEEAGVDKQCDRVAVDVDSGVG